MSEALLLPDDPQDDEEDLHPDLDWKNPDYAPVFRERAARLAWLRANPREIPALKAYYATRPWRFIDDWGMTIDPRKASGGALTILPFCLFPRQVQFLKWVERMRLGKEVGLCEKSRELGVSWLCVGAAVCWFCCIPGFITGMGSRKQEYVDQLGDEKSLFEKIRRFLSMIPSELWPPGFDLHKHAAYQRVWCPSNGAAIVGEVGDNIGRGGRTSAYFVDEAAFITHQEMVDAALSNNTFCKIDVSSVNGAGNLFYEKRMRYERQMKDGGPDRLFIFDWREDPRKDDAWYASMQEKFSEVIVAQEVDRDYQAAQENQMIPGKWITAAIDAHIRLGFRPEGIRVTGFDPADTGDAKAVVNRWGSVILEAEEKKTGTINDALPWAVDHADESRADVLRYDGDGMGTPVMRVYFARASSGRFLVQAFNGSGAVEDPDDIYRRSGARRDEPTSEERRNKDRFQNFRAQAWTWAHDRFRDTYDAIQRANRGEIVNADPETLVSISSNCKHLHQLVSELSRPMRETTGNGKIKVESKVDARKRGVPSWNLADACIMALATRRVTSTGVPRRPAARVERMGDRGAGY